MRFLVLGGGLQGSACAYDLLRQEDVTRITLADLSADAGASFLSDDPRLDRIGLDFRDTAAVGDVMDEHDVVLSAAPYYFNAPMARLAIGHGCDFSDLGGNTEILFEQLEMNDLASATGVSVVPDVGLAPGLVVILAAEGIRRLDRAESAKMYVGGLPQNPVPPLNYQVVYSLEGALDYYTTPSAIIRDGRRTEIDALSEIEPLEFGELGRLEAFHTAGGASILPWRYEGKVDRLEYKTLRYPGHAEIMRSIRTLGLLADRPLEVKGQSVIPRDVFIAAVSPLLVRPEEPDLVALRVVVSGEKDGARVTHEWNLLDRRDEQTGITAMERTTGFTLAVVGLLMGRDVIDEPGVMPPDEAVPPDKYLEEMAERGVVVRYRQVPD